MSNSIWFSFGIILAMGVVGISVTDFGFLHPVYGQTGEDLARKTAIDFISTSPTFSFDGIKDSIVVQSTRTFDTSPPEYVVFLSFDSAHAGYGDRSDQVLAQVITNHNALIKVVNGKVVTAILDSGTWDELNQKMLIEDGTDNNSTEESTAMEISKKFLTTSPTYMFDGLGTIQHKSVKMLKSNPPQYVVETYFESANSGYGNREGQILTQVVTPHTLSVTIVEGKVVSAVIDDTWDELNQEFLDVSNKPKDPVVYDKETKYTPELFSPKAKLNSTNVLQQGRTVTFDDGQFSLSFVSVIEDSRCASDVICVWEGEAVIKVEIGANQKVIRELELTLNEKPSKLLDRYFIKFAELKPYPQSDKKIAESDYIATILISSYEIYSPRVQLENGLEPSQVTCADGLTLLKKLSKDSVGCVSDSTAQKLIERGWGILFK